jgi:hypothetical protein
MSIVKASRTHGNYPQRLLGETGSNLHIENLIDVCCNTVQFGFNNLINSPKFDGFYRSGFITVCSENNKWDFFSYSIGFENFEEI